MNLNFWAYLKNKLRSSRRLRTVPARRQPDLPDEWVEPIAQVCSMAEWRLFYAGEAAQKTMEHDAAILNRHACETEWTYRGYSYPAAREVDFIVDMQWGGRVENGRNTPNVRERLVCPVTSLNNRQRLSAALTGNLLSRKADQRVYFMEQITPLFQWARKAFPHSDLIGSEYLGYQYKAGQKVNGVRHEDIHALSFGDNSIDLIVSNEVFEHIPDPEKAFSECARILRPGGQMLMTTPFFPDYEQSLRRARIDNGQLDLLQPPEYHGNPVSEEGSLVFYDFGWDILEMAGRGGFSRCQIEIYHSPRHGHLGLQSVFRLEK